MKMRSCKLRLGGNLDFMIVNMHLPLVNKQNLKDLLAGAFVVFHLLVCEVNMGQVLGRRNLIEGLIPKLALTLR